MLSMTTATTTTMTAAYYGCVRISVTSPDNVCVKASYRIQINKNNYKKRIKNPRCDRELICVCVYLCTKVQLELYLINCTAHKTGETKNKTITKLYIYVKRMRDESNVKKHKRNEIQSALQLKNAKGNEVTNEKPLFQLFYTLRHLSLRKIKIRCALNVGDEN